MHWGEGVEKEEQEGLIVGHGRGGSAREEGSGAERERVRRSEDCRNITGTVIDT